MVVALHGLFSYFFIIRKVKNILLFSWIGLILNYSTTFKMLLPENQISVRFVIYMIRWPRHWANCQPKFIEIRLYQENPLMETAPFSYFIMKLFVVSTH